MKSAISFLLCSVVLLAAFPAHAQKWNYQTYRQSDGRPSAPGYITLQEKDGEAMFQLVATPMLDPCLNHPLKADVTRTDTLMTIVPRFDLQGCIPMRVNVKLDGSGGYVEFKQGESWRKSRHDRGLTLVK